MAANIPSIIGGAVGSAIGGPVGGAIGQLAQRAASFVVPFANWTPALFVPYRRSIGGIFAQVTIDEQHTDEVQITDHPVEAGAPISDHAFARPQQIAITAGWSKATAYDLSAESGVYGILLALQTSFQPFDIYTGKRHYKNMLIERLAVTTDQHNEFTLIANIVCRQVIIVNTTTSKVTGQSESSQDQTDPEKTAQPQGKGEKSTDDPSSGDQKGYKDTTSQNDQNGTVGGEKGISLYEGGGAPSSISGSVSGGKGDPTTGSGVLVSPNNISTPPPINQNQFIEPPPSVTPAQIVSP